MKNPQIFVKSYENPNISTVPFEVDDASLVSVLKMWWILLDAWRVAMVRSLRSVDADCGEKTSRLRDQPDTQPGLFLWDFLRRWRAVSEILRFMKYAIFIHFFFDSSTISQLPDKQL